MNIPNGYAFKVTKKNLTNTIYPTVFCSDDKNQALQIRKLSQKYTFLMY